MKTLESILLQAVFLLLLSQLTYSQEVEVNLGGNSKDDAFVVKDSSGNNLLRVDGDRNFGINAEQPNGIEIKGRSYTTPHIDGDPLLITGGDAFGNGGTVSIIGGRATADAGGDVGGSINITSGSGPSSGNVNIYSGASDYGTSGTINIRTSGAQFDVGDINISTGNSNSQGGSINLFTEWGNTGGNSINLITGGTDNGANDISLLSSGKLTLNTLGPFADASQDNNIRIETHENVWGWNNIELIVGNDGDEGNSRGIILSPNGGVVEVIGSGTYTGSWTQASDERYKSNIIPLNDLLSKVKLLEPVEYDWNKEDYPDKNFSDGKQIGLIAQDVEEIFPKLVSTDRDGYKSIDYSKLSVLLLQAMKEQQSEIDKQADEISDMKSDIEELKLMIMQDSNKLTSN